MFPDRAIKCHFFRRSSRVGGGLSAHRQASGRHRTGHTKKLQPNPPMLSYAVIFLIIALLAGVLGFGVVAGTAATIAKVCFVVFLVLFLFSLFTGRRRL